MIGTDKKKKGKVCFNDSCFVVELAMNKEEKRKGLMESSGLKDNEGMLFLNEKEDVYSFWMKNVSFPLDIIWINKDKEVVFISQNAQPCFDDFCPSINPGIKAKYVLEINGGLSNKIGLKTGSKLDIIIDNENIK